MIGELNGQSINTKTPINGFGTEDRYMIPGFLDTVFAPLGTAAALGLPGFTDTVFDPLVFRDGTEEVCTLNPEDRCAILVSVRCTCEDY
jgi:hypothetical protein